MTQPRDGHEMRARRSLLFVPGDDARKTAKAAASGADCVILDLEDGVAAAKKQAARETVATSLATVDFGRSERLVRLNPVSSELHAGDVEATFPARPDGYVIPKVESAVQIREIASRTSSQPLPLLALIESARGVAELKEISASDPRLAALLFGAEDLAGDLGAVRTPEGAEGVWARGAVVIMAAAHALQAIDTVFIDLNDEEGLRRESWEACRMGYAGKMAIHPKQIGVIHEAFTPNDAEIERAQHLVEEHARQQALGKGAFSLDGKMVDWPMVRAAQRLLVRARAAGKI
ncbi:MAG TPA: CoA ester lyase [Candidatus Polarisedimenticolia bacterium]|jgi:citrate lyase beta subunit|nr:CoA ester lyase [Candidatus Polarisedimenticolia bacterium]